MPRWLILMALLVLTTPVLAAYYDHTPYPYAWIDPSSHGKVVWTGANGGTSACTGGYSAVDDDISAELPLGFTFNFGGVGYANVRIMSNGRLQFNNTYCYFGSQTDSPRTYTLAYPDANLVRTLRVYGADMDPTQGGTSAYVSYAQQGSAPNRRFVVTWKDVRDYNSVNSRFNLQVILMENGDFIYQYGGIVNSTGGKAQSGWELSGGDFDSLAFNNIQDLQKSAVRFFRANNLADWTMEGDFSDASGHGYHGTGVDGAAAGFANDPAFANTSQSTCQYAQLDTTSGGEKRYIQLGALASTTFNSSFTVTAWLRSTNVGDSGQRIFVDDDNQDGWALSLGDGGSGKVRLFNRNLSFSGASGGGTTSGVIFDTPAVVANNLWYFLAASVDLYLNQATLYLYDSHGAQLAATTASLSGSVWCPTGACGGAIALGGETLASSEGVNGSFHFKGNLDEVRLWQGVLPQSYVESALSRTRPCSATAASTPGGFNAVEVGADALAGRITTKAAGGAFNLDLVALNATRTGLASGFSGSVLVDLIANTALGVALDANNCPVTGTRLNVGSVAMTSSRITQTFAALADSWRDVRVRMRYPASGSTSVTACSSDNFAVKPAVLTAIASHADWQTPGTTTTLANTAATGGAVHKAGQPFTLRVSGYNAANAVTGNYDGSPGTTLTCALPASGCVVGSFSTGTFSAAAGTLTSNTASYAEVGAVSATFTDTGYASVDSGDTAATCAGYYVCSSPVNIGRFVPDHYDIASLQTPQFQTFGSTCASRSFTYLDQPFGFQTLPRARITARNAAGGTTANYSGGLWKLSPNGHFASTWRCQKTGGASCGSVSVTAAGFSAGNLVANGDGSGDFTWPTNAIAPNGVKYQFQRETPPVAPFSAEIGLGILIFDSSETGNCGLATCRILDSQGAAVTWGTNIAFDAGNGFRQGRLRLSNAAGSELLPLPVPLTAQYWNGQGWVANAADQCTALSAPTLTFFPQTADNRLASGETTASFNANLVAGNGNLRFSAPGAGNFGFLDLTVAAPVWLRFNWDGVDQGSDGDLLDDNPHARASFGKRGGASKVIIRRELY